MKSSTLFIISKNSEQYHKFLSQHQFLSTHACFLINPSEQDILRKVPTNSFLTVLPNAYDDCSVIGALYFNAQLTFLKHQRVEFWDFNGKRL